MSIQTTVPGNQRQVQKGKKWVESTYTVTHGMMIIFRSKKTQTPTRNYS